MGALSQDNRDVLREREELKRQKELDQCISKKFHRRLVGPPENASQYGETERTEKRRSCTDAFGTTLNYKNAPFSQTLPLEKRVHLVVGQYGSD